MTELAPFVFSPLLDPPSSFPQERSRGCKQIRQKGVNAEICFCAARGVAEKGGEQIGAVGGRKEREWEEK